MSSDISFNLGGSHCNFGNKMLQVTPNKKMVLTGFINVQILGQNRYAFGAKSLSTIRARTPCIKNKSSKIIKIN